MKKIYILTLFPEYFTPLLKLGVVGQFLEGKRREVPPQIVLIDIRNFAQNKYKSVDDSPFGGGHGMVMRADILKRALVEGILKVDSYKEEDSYKELVKDNLHVVATTARGEVWKAEKAKEFAAFLTNDRSNKDLVFICGRYEGIDERFLKIYCHEEISLGDFILSGGEIAVLSILDSLLRFVPGVLGDINCAFEDSFEDNLLEAPKFTKPRLFEGIDVPSVYLSGHHSKISLFEQEERKKMTALYRPDLIKNERK